MSCELAPALTIKKPFLEGYSMAKRIFLFAILIVNLLILDRAAWAQDDFGFVPNVPPWNQPNLPPGPVPGMDYQWGTVWGPEQLNVRKGDTIRIRYKLDWWGLGPLSTAITGPNLENWRLDYSNGVNNRNQWGHPTGDGIGFWCIECDWLVDAGDDYVTIQLDYMGSSQFGAHLEVVDIIQAPRRSLYTAEQKDNARWWRDTTGNVTSYIDWAATLYCWVIPLRYCGALVAGHFVSNNISNHFATIVVDPFDPWYQYPFEPELELGWSLTGDYAIDAVIQSAMYASGYAQAADVTLNRASSCLEVGDGCVWWQMDRLRSQQYYAGWWLQNTANWLYVLRDEAYWDGEYDLYNVLDSAAGTLWGAGDFLMSQ